MTIRGILVIALHLVFLFSFLLFAWHFYVSDSPIYKIDIIKSSLLWSVSKALQKQAIQFLCVMTRFHLLSSIILTYSITTAWIIWLLFQMWSKCSEVLVWEKLQCQLFQAIKSINWTGNFNSGFIGTMLERNISKYTNLISGFATHRFDTEGICVRKMD